MKTPEGETFLLFMLSLLKMGQVTSAVTIFIQWLKILRRRCRLKLVWK